MAKQTMKFRISENHLSESNDYLCKAKKVIYGKYDYTMESREDLKEIFKFYFSNLLLKAI
jgi:hypothetical protein